MKTCPFLDDCPPSGTCAQHYAQELDRHLATSAAFRAAHTGDTRHDPDARTTTFCLRPTAQGLFNLEALLC